MGDLAVVKAPRNRSRLGCTRCKKRRQKCDEKKPSCSGCVDNSEPCVYEISLRWGGRDFKRFDSPAVTKYHFEPGSFIYVSSQQKKAPSPSQELGMSLQPFSSVKALDRGLLHHFIHEASRITSCHPQIQLEFCQLIVPMAINYPALFSALMALSAIHKASLYDSEAPVDDIVAFKTSSIVKLREELVNFTNNDKDAALATILTLCMCEIHSGADKPRSWRLHLEGAQAILGPQDELISENPTSAISLLRRWFISIEALASLTEKGLKAGQARSISYSPMLSFTSEPSFYLDDYFGYSTELVAVFKEIGAAAWERQTAEYGGDGEAFVALSSKDFEDEADTLEAAMWERILRDHIAPPPFYDGVEQRLSENTIFEFRLCNEAHQYAALIHILRRVRKSPKKSTAVQSAVKNIVRCCEQIIPQPGLSPWIVLMMPLFTAGLEAVGDDRDTIKRIMIRLHDSLKLKNIQRSIDLLERCWSTDGDVEMNVLQDQNCDFIPY